MKAEFYFQKFYQEYFQLLSKFIAYNATPENKKGLFQSAEELSSLLQKSGFELKRFEDKGYNDIFVATLSPNNSSYWLGMYGHYDVETNGEGWNSSPEKLTLREERLYGRGTADNLGPLALRLLALQKRNKNQPHPGIVWLIQGEEEVGSPFAHKVFPELKFSEVRFWIEETGYFNEKKGQRFLISNPNEEMEKIYNFLAEIAKKEGKLVYRQQRYLNKAFGNDRCPFLNHIVKENPYIAFGPNDDRSAIHKKNESLPKNTLALSFYQFNLLLDEVSQWN